MSCKWGDQGVFCWPGRRLVGTVGKGIKAWHVDTKRMVAHVRLDPSFPDVRTVACSPADPSFACASSSSHNSGTRSSSCHSCLVIPVCLTEIAVKTVAAAR